MRHGAAPRVLAVAAVALWAFVFRQVSSASGASVAGFLHFAQLVSLLGFVGGCIAALWELWLVCRGSCSGITRSFAVLVAAAFCFMLYIALHYHLIGLSGEY